MIWCFKIGTNAALLQIVLLQNRTHSLIAILVVRCFSHGGGCTLEHTRGRVNTCGLLDMERSIWRMKYGFYS